MPANEDRNLRVGIIAAVGGGLVLAALFGFLIVPVFQGHEAGVSAWTAICRAVGVAPGSPAMPQISTQAQPQPVSDVAWEPRLLEQLASVSTQAGAQLATQMCASCHGAEGISASAQFPNLAGQSAAAIYKQLRDFKSGARKQAIMSPMAQPLNDEQMASVARYFAASKAVPKPKEKRSAGDAQAQALVERGEPARRIPGCDSCHGAGVGGPIEAPLLAGQSADYLANQLKAFASGERRNDVYGRMRNIAAALTPEQLNAVARYYAERP